MKPYYSEGGVTIYHGDCREVVPTLGDGSVDMVLTDPPYGLDIGYGRTALGTRTIEGDSTTDLMLWVAKECPRVLADDRWAAFFCDYSAVGEVQAKFSALGLGVKTVGIWDKGAPTLGEGIRNQYEMFVLARKGKAPERFCGGNVWRCTQAGGRPVHPHEKPLSVLRRLVDNYSEPGGLVLDPCMGSGTTLRAAKDCGRRAIGIEVEEKWCELAVRLLAQGSLFQEGDMPTTPGHKLIRERQHLQAEGDCAYRWKCECGHDLGPLSVHRARANHKEHKEAAVQIQAESVA